ncbi:hypothetical protein SRS16CHR_03598 [Variovorax sp. SRS16]|uniref:hypothetical protein n=1 Tax=Variovorax sp. SRS16 TaxID=282217 RepID=UPI001316EA92|nr:hypothetical protein [Variovorax sp. SRS16]VTU25129.1 hypothetical protein SRS16CHR_03598 [Variovorax sp. SRS16]
MTTIDTAATAATAPTPPGASPRRSHPSLTGDRNQCPTCGDFFNSTHAFDRHRIGRHAGNQRRCLTAPEMEAQGIALTASGFWVSEIRRFPTTK